ncbi:MAG TPA: DegT/DnrJ/EryC1/StrS family aminotransferase [Chloroflexi bacterium]|nr:DegT/DnrJ/EryC1/StrS family aminotransferase [Chloroflexota bacterium]
MTNISIPVAEPMLKGRELEYISDCITSGWVSSKGKYVNRFERNFAEFCGVKRGIATFNGTIALHLALAALNIGPGDEVIVPTLTFVATANAVAYTGATPVFVDSEAETWNIDPKAIEDAITPRSKAIIPVHLYGHPADMDPLLEIAKAHNLIVIEDAAEAHGARYKGRPVGSLGDAAIFSFMGNKIITTGEGGLIVSNNKELTERAFFLQNHARYAGNPYWHTEIGFNYRMTNLQAALGVAQLEQIDDFIAIRRKNAAYYMERLKNIPGLTMPPEAEWAENVYWMFAPLIEPEFGVERDAVIEKLRQKGIESRPFFYPIHTMPMYATGQSLPIAESLAARGINLPSGTTLTTKQIDFVCDALKTMQKDSE